MAATYTPATQAPDEGPVRIALDAWLNNRGGSPRTDLSAGEFNVWGNSFPAAQLPRPGEVFHAERCEFVLSRSARGADNVRCSGQYIPVAPGRYDWIYVLAAGERRVEEQVGLHFADDAVDIEELCVSDFWAAEAAYGESPAADCPVMHYPHHVQHGVPARLWCQRIPVVRRGELVGIRLPEDRALHVFALTLMPAVSRRADNAARSNRGAHPRAASGRIAQWYRDPISCLHSTVASVLQTHGHDPLAVLGTRWQFCSVENDVRSEEFYFPDPHGELAAAIAPDSGLRSCWRRASEPDIEPLRRALAEGELPIAAVDNYYLPFRPAFGDVHAAHLVIVFDIDDARGEVLVSDAMPPAFEGPVPMSDFLLSWRSINPADRQDAFFSDAPIGGRWLALDVCGVNSRLSPDRLRRALNRNVEGFRAGTRGEVSTGMAGLRHWADALVDAARRCDARALIDTYVFGWSMQAQAAVHGELLRGCGRDWDAPVLAEAGRLVERVSALWTGVRVTAAHGRSAPEDAAAELARHTARLVRGHDEALEAVERAAAALPDGAPR